MKFLRSLCSVLFFLFIFSDCQQPVLLVIGTRPEGIKMIPVYFALKELDIPTVLCSTDQHTNLLSDDVFSIFKVNPDIHCNIMKPNQDLFYITTAVMEHMKSLLKEINPSLVLVQGDTTTAMATALAAFYLKIPVGHVEAGLRTGKMYAPFPEEINRSFIDTLSTFHFVPTELSQENLLKENVDQDSIFIVGNTVVDALHSIKHQIDQQNTPVNKSLEQMIETKKNEGKKIMLLTAHRRESFGDGLFAIFTAIKHALEDHPDLYIIYPVHPNPAIQDSLIKSGLSSMENIMIGKPLPYTDLVYLLHMVDFIATDSGGIQEEGVSLGKPVLVLRNETDRPEGVIAGVAQLVGTCPDKIINGIKNCLQQKRSYANTTIYGDGTASRKIAQIIDNFLNQKGI